MPPSAGMMASLQQPIAQAPMGPPMGQPQMGQPMGQPQMGQPMGQPQMGHPQMGHPQMGHPQQMHQQMPPMAYQSGERKKRMPIGLIVGIIGGVVAILAVVVVLLLGKKDGGDKETADAGDSGKAAEVGTLNLELTPADAKVTVDGTEHAGGSPRVVSGLNAGVHKLEVSKDGFVGFSQDVTVTGGQTLSLPLKLQARDVTLKVSVDPAAATLSIVAGETPTEIGKGQPSYAHALKREDGVSYKLTAKADGYEDVSVPLVFSGDASQDVAVTLVAKAGTAPTPAEVVEDKPKPKSGGTKPKPKPKTAELKIGVAPGNPPADVYVDGKKEGRAPVFVKVSPGSHTVKWKWDDGKSDTQKVSVGDKEVKLLKGSK